MDCEQEGCLFCQDLDKCVQCDEKEVDGYYPVGETCAFCNSTENRFIKDGVCQLCSLPGCIQCMTADACGQCDEDNNFYLDEGVCLLCDPALNEVAEGGKCV